MPIICKKDIIYEQLKREISDGSLPLGSRLPREIDFAKSLGVGQVTLRSALTRLKDEGLIERMPGKGTFVSKASTRRTFLLVLPDGARNLETPTQYIAAGIDEAASGKAVTLEYCPIGLLNSFNDRECQEMITRHRIKGVLLETGHAQIDIKLINKLKKLKLPVVIPHGLPGDAVATGFRVLQTDERTAWGSGLRYLANAGHRIIASMLLDLPQENLTTVRGFTQNELKEFYHHNGFPNAEALIRLIPNQLDIITDTIHEWILGAEPPTAIMCHSDRLAMRVYQVLKELRVLIPQQVSVMGYSNYPGSQLSLPPLTTIDIQFEECGRMALEELLCADEWYKPGITPPEIITPYKVIERDSVKQFN